MIKFTYKNCYIYVDVEYKNSTSEEVEKFLMKLIEQSPLLFLDSFTTYYNKELIKVKPAF